VRYVLEGGVKSDQQVRSPFMQLIEATTGYHPLVTRQV
jgi:hypothetical protein